MSVREGWASRIHAVLMAKPVIGMTPEEVAQRMGMKLERVQKHLSVMTQYGEIDRIQEARVVKVIRQPSIYRVKPQEEEVQ